MKSAYQSSVRISAVSRLLPLASNQSIVARKSRCVAGSKLGGVVACPGLSRRAVVAAVVTPTASQTRPG